VLFLNYSWNLNKLAFMCAFLFVLFVEVLNMLPADKEYGHAMAPTTASVTVTCDLVTVHASPHDCVTLTSVSHCIEPSTSSSASGGSSVGAAAAAFDDLTLTAVPPMQPYYDQVRDVTPGLNRQKPGGFVGSKFIK